MSDGTASNDALPRGTVLRGYSIRQVLGQGGFGIVYRARHIELGNVVAIKEYLPAELAVRVGSSVRPRSAAYVDFYQDGLRRFRKEGQALVALHNQSGIVSCRDFFRRNNTAYLVMEFEAGRPLSQVLQERESEGRPFSEEDLMEVAVPLLEGLGHVHAAGMVHRDIKPSNLLLREADGEPVLIDFGAAKLDVAGQTKSMAPRTPGYAAWEQIVPDGELGPWTDIYAIGVLLWRIVAGGSPSSERMHPVPVERRMDAVVRGEPEPMASATELGSGRFNPEILAAIDSCLKLKYDERIQDCTELLGLLRLEGGSQYGVAMRIYRRIPGYHSRNRDSHSEESGYGSIRISPLLSEVFEWLSLAAAKDHAAAQYELAFLHHHGIGASHDPSLARDLLHRSANSGHEAAQLSLAFIYGFAFIHSRYENIYPRYKFNSDSEVGRACATYLFDLYLPNRCYRIYPTRNDYEDPNLPQQTARWICICDDFYLHRLHRIYNDPFDPPFKITEGRHKEPLVTIPTLLADDIRSRLDIEKIGRGLFEKLTPPTPLEEVQYEIGHIFERGDLVPQDLREATRWYRVVAEPERSPRKVGVKWPTKQLEACRSADSRLRVLAKSGIEEARDYCWSMYHSGRIAPENIEDAFNWIQFGAMRGNADAQYHLGWMYWNGKGVSCNDSESVNWFRAAARSGNPHAQNSLGVSYFFGRGVVQSYAKAQAWFLLAAGSYAITRPNLAHAKFMNIPDRELELNQQGTVAIRRLLICITRDNAMRRAIEWEDQASRDCFHSAYSHLEEEKKQFPWCFVAKEYDDGQGIFQFNPTSKFFHEDGTFSFAYSTSIDPHRCEISEDSMFAFRMHPWDLGCLRAVYNFALSRFIQFYSAIFTDSSAIESEHWFLSVLSWLSDHNYPLARYIHGICIASKRPYEAFSEMCLAADQNHCESQAILSMMYAVSEGIDLNSSLFEEQLSGLAMKRYWTNAVKKFGSSGYGRESVAVCLTESIIRHHSSHSEGNGVPLGIGVVEQSQFDLDPWGIWGFDVSVCRLFPKKWYELWPLFHSGNLSDSTLDILRNYAKTKGQEYECDYDYWDPVTGELRREFSRNVSHVRMLRQIRLAAFRGDKYAQYAFGALYVSGDCVAVDYALAVDFLRESAIGGNENACFVLGLLYEHGHGVVRDNQVSRSWYRSSGSVGITDFGSGIDEEAESMYPASCEGAIVEGSVNNSGRSRYLFYRDQARTPCLWTDDSWDWWFASRLGCRLSKGWLTADFDRPSWDG